jgi:transcriptional regulator with XRE-family HTH domain
MISGTQVRAARATLGWSVRDLALRSFVSIAAIELIERREGQTDENQRQLRAIQATLELTGIDFGGDPTASKRPRRCSMSALHPTASE